MSHNPSSTTFFGLGIAPRLLDALTRLRYTTPTPIQEKAIPIAIEGKDLIGIAQTGTGKTLAFGIPMIQRIGQSHATGLVVLPTRELALQVDEALRKIGHTVGLKTAVLIGGASMRPQIQAIARRPHIVVGTPGRIIDHLDQKTLSLSGISILVLDEADRMLDMGFLPQIKRILVAVSRERQTMLFSATLSSEIMRVASSHMQLPIRIEVAPPGTTADRVSQEFFVVRKEAKSRLLDKVLAEYKGSALVFTRTKFAAQRVVKSVRDMGHSAAEIHSNRSLNQRRDALEGFRSGKYRVLVATDIAARGIDVKGIELVVNYDFPMHSEDYVHRIGRTARAGAAGHAISFVLPEEQRGLRNIERLIRKSVRVSELPDLPPARPVSYQPRQHEQYVPKRPPFHSRGGKPFFGRRQNPRFNQRGSRR